MKTAFSPVAPLTFQTTAEWAAARRNMIGASESPALMGANPWRSAFGVYSHKKGEEVEETSKMRAGQVFEHAIATFYAGENSLNLYTPAEWENLRLARVGSACCLAHDDRVVWRIPGSVLSCTPDFFVTDGAEFEAPLEVKRIDPDQRMKWKDGPPIYYVLQVQQQLGVLRECGMPFDEGLLVADFGGDDVRPYYIKFDADLWLLIRETCERFWREHVAPSIPPEPDHLTSSEEVGRLWKRAVVGSSVEVDPIVFAKYRDAKQALKIAEDAADQAQAALKSAMKEAEGATVGGVLVATWKNRVANISAKAAYTQTTRPLILTKAAQAV
jgi:predicted phage-related endonuclease